MRKIAFLALAGALALSACGKKAPEEEAPMTNNLVEPPVENIVEEPEAPPPSNNATAASAPAPAISDDQQMLDDADASGMTSRLREGGGESQPADEAMNHAGHE